MQTDAKKMRAACVEFWGAPDKQRTIAPGVTWYTTPGHGGFVVSPELFPLSQEAKDSTDGCVARWVNRATQEVVLELYGFEEDEGWAFLFYHHPELAEAAVRKGGIFAADATAEYLLKHARSLVASRIVWRAQQEAKKVEPELWAKAAWGDWQEGVPKGQVKVLTMAGTEVFLPKDDYKPGERGFGYTEGA